jgi:hypothetical protein
MMSGLLDNVNGRLATVVAAIVSINSGLSSCSTETANRYSGFRTAVATEETFWKDRFADYTNVMGTADKEERARKLWALAALAGHGVPDFAEYRLGLFDDRAAIKAAQARLNGMRDTLNAALTTARAANPEVASAVQKSVAFDSQQEKLAASAVASPDAPPVADPLTRINTTAPNHDNLTLSNGSPGGWDIDIFWCEGGIPTTESANYTLALDRAQRLAQLASAKAKLSPSVLLGRVRLRPLPELRQGGGYPAPGSANTIRAESSQAEQDAAAALMAVLNRYSPGFTLAGSNSPTPTYLSAFVCGTPATSAQSD